MGQWASLDWNWIRTTPPRQLVLPEGWSFILSEAVFWEAAEATIDGKDATGVKLKLRTLYERHADQLYVGRNPMDLAMSEFAHAPGTCMPFANIVQQSETLAMRNIAALTSSEFLAGLSRIPGNWGPLLETKRRFDGLRPAFASKATELAPDLARKFGGDDLGLRAFIRQPDSILKYAKWRISEGVPTDWESSLSEFPDRAAFGRWMRLELWLVWRSLQAGVSDNDFEDMMYAFLASYCGVLVSADRKLGLLCSDVLPHVRVVATAAQLTHSP